MGDLDGVTVPQREKWGNKIEFLLSCVGYAVGLGNVWRFPYLAYKNGGGVFFIPYLIFLFGGGIPIFFLEVAMGQFTAEGGITAWGLIPIFKGIGYGTIVCVSLLNVYYIVVLAWALLFLWNSLTPNLPWATCDNSWNTEACFLRMANSSVTVSHSRVDPATEFWDRKILHRSSGIHEIGSIRWDLALTLFIAWTFCYICICRGIKTSGKVVYFTAIFPYIMLGALFIRGITLPGALEGITYYLKPDATKLASAQVWMDAGTQIFFSYAVALGALTALGSYNEYHHNCFKDCMIIACINSSTSVFAGMVIFSVLGFMSNELQLPIAEVAQSGPGLVFIAYPKAIAQMPGAPIWAVLFFVMILFVGLDSQFVQVEGIITALVDMFPRQLRHAGRRAAVTAFVCFLTFLVGLLMVTEGGVYFVQLFDYYAASGVTLLWLCFFECIAMAWVYGIEKWYDELHEMLQFRLGYWMRFSWRYVVPLICAGIFLFSLINYTPLRYNEVYLYPPWAEGIGWALALSSMLCVPVYAVYSLATAEGTLQQRWNQLIVPAIQSSKKNRENKVDNETSL